MPASLACPFGPLSRKGLFYLYKRVRESNPDRIFKKYAQFFCFPYLIHVLRQGIVPTRFKKFFIFSTASKKHRSLILLRCFGGGFGWGPTEGQGNRFVSWGRPPWQIAMFSAERGARPRALIRSPAPSRGGHRPGPFGQRKWCTATPGRSFGGGGPCAGRRPRGSGSSG